MTLPGAAGRVLEGLPASSHHSIYDETGSVLYHRLTEHDVSEVPELLAALRDVRGPILELACGSGRLTLPLLRAGFDVTAIDDSPAMIELLRGRAAQVGEDGARPGQLEARVEDMARFDLGETFAAVVIGTTSITLLDDAQRAACFACVRGHLRPGGVFLLSAMDVEVDDDAVAVESATPLPGAAGELLEYLDPAGARRWTSIVLRDASGEPAQLFSSSMRLLPSDTLVEELAAASLALTARHAIDLGADVPGRRDVLLEVHLAGEQTAPAGFAAPRSDAEVSPSPAPRTAAVELFVAPSRFGDPSRQAISATGTRISFADGSTALDGDSGLWNVNLGYGNPVVADAIAQASRDASYLTLFRYGHAYAERAAHALIDAVAPAATYNRVLFATAGGAALDGAIKLARQHAQLVEAPKRRIVVGLRGSYHGLTFGAHGLTGEDLGQAAYGVDQRLVRHVAHDDPREIERLLRAQGDCVAAVILEPILGSGAHVVAPEVVEAILRGREAHGYTVVADEVAAGFGRTGPLFASQDWPSQPDLLVTSKGLTNGTCAASAILWAPRITEAFDAADAILVHGETQSGTPQSCAAIEATLQQFEALDALARGRSVAERLDGALREIAAASPRVTGIPGRGCFRALQLGDGDGNPLGGASIDSIVTDCLAAGAIVHPGPSSIQLVPALTYAPEDLDALLERVGGVIEAL